MLEHPVKSQGASTAETPSQKRARIIRRQPCSSLSVLCDWLEERGELDRLLRWEERIYQYGEQHAVKLTAEIFDRQEIQADWFDGYARYMIQHHQLENRVALEDCFWSWLYRYPTPPFMHRIVCQTLVEEFPEWDWKQFPVSPPPESQLESPGKGPHELP